MPSTGGTSPPPVTSPDERFLMDAITADEARSFRQLARVSTCV